MKNLSDMTPGQIGVIVDIQPDNRRFKALGLTEGTKVKCVLKSPLGDPKAYRIRETVFAIRKEDGDSIAVEVF